MIKLIIYDLDGTIIDSISVFMSAYKYALKYGAGLDLTYNTIAKHLGPNEIGVFKKMAPENANNCLEIFYKTEKSKITDIVLFNGMKELLLKCANANINQAIVTGRAKYHAEYFLHHFGIKHHFHDVLTGSDSKDIKTSNIKKLVDKYGYRPNETLYLGDTIGDIVAAKNASVTPILCSWKDDPVRYDQLGKMFQNISAFETIEEFEKWVFKGVINE